MMTTANKIVFSLSISHSYFENGMCRDLVYSASPATEKFMKRFGFNFRFRMNGFDLFVNTKQSIENYFGYITNTTGQNCFDFLIRSKNSNFLSLTDLPFNWLGQLIYNSSNTHAGTDGRIIMDAQLQQSDTVFSIATLSIAFSDLLKNSSGNTAPHFEIQFLSRSTLWQYFVINKNALNLDDAAIVGKSEITFTRVGKTTIQNGEEAILFTCNNPLMPLSEKPNYKFDLVGNDPKKDAKADRIRPSAKVIFKALPNPDPSHSGIAIINGVAQVTSPMYVYV